VPAPTANPASNNDPAGNLGPVAFATAHNNKAPTAPAIMVEIKSGAFIRCAELYSLYVQRFRLERIRAMHFQFHPWYADAAL
jgi:hypothetical protein